MKYWSKKQPLLCWLAPRITLITMKSSLTPGREKGKWKHDAIKLDIKPSRRKKNFPFWIFNALGKLRARRERFYLLLGRAAVTVGGTQRAPLILHHHQQQSQWTHPEEMETYFLVPWTPEKIYALFTRNPKNLPSWQLKEKEKQHKIPKSRIFLVCEFVQLSAEICAIGRRESFPSKSNFMRDGSRQQKVSGI